MPHIIPIRDLKDTAAISQMCNESNEPIYITKNGYGDMVIMSMKAYEEKMYLLDVYAKLAEGRRGSPHRSGNGSAAGAEGSEGEAWAIKS